VDSLGNKLVAGDTLFRDSIGRTDLPARRPPDPAVDPRQAAHLPDQTVVIPGTRYTTIGREKRSNWFLQD